MTDFFIRTKQQLIERNKTLKKIKKILNDLNINFFLEGGVLLGAIRNKNFIKWDHDVEVGVLSDSFERNIIKILYKAHQKNLNILSVDSDKNNLKINLFEHYHTKFSILGFKKTKNFLERNIYRYPSKFFSPMKSLNFLGQKYDIPNNVHEFLSWTYGDWKKEVKSRNNRVYLDKRVFNSRLNLYLKKNFSIIKLLFYQFYKKFFIFNFFKFQINSFQYFINTSNKKKIIYFDIASNNSFENLKTIKNNIIHRAIVIESKKKNIESIKKILRIYKIDKKKFEILNFGISNKNYVGTFYSNLDFNNFNKDHKRIRIKYRSLSNILKNYKINNDLVFRINLEGQELKLFEGAIKYFLNNNKISIFLNLYPAKYKKGEMEKIFKKLFNNGYKVRLLETADNVMPYEFKKYGLIPFKTLKNSILFNNVTNEFVLKHAFTPTFRLTKFDKRGYIDRIFKNMMIEKNE